MLCPDKRGHSRSTTKTTNNMQWKKQIILYTHAFAFTRPKKYHSSQDFIPSFLAHKSAWKTSSKKTPKRRKQNIRNNIADGHKTYADTKCTAHGLAMMSFVFAPAAGGGGGANRCCNSAPRSTVPWNSTRVCIRTAFYKHNKRPVVKNYQTTMHLVITP